MIRLCVLLGALALAGCSQSIGHIDKDEIEQANVYCQSMGGLDFISVYDTGVGQAHCRNGLLVEYVEPAYFKSR